MTDKTLSNSEILRPVKGKGSFSSSGSIAHNTDISAARNILHFAVANNDVDAIEEILDRGRIYINTRNHLKETPLHFAAIFCSIEALGELLDHSLIDVDAQNSYGETALHIAIPGIQKDNEYYKFTQMLLEYGEPNVNLREVNGDTPMHIAVRHMNFEALAMLLEVDDSDVRIENNDRQTPVSLAKSLRKKNISIKNLVIIDAMIKMLLRKQARSAEEFLELLKAYF